MGSRVGATLTGWAGVFGTIYLGIISLLVSWAMFCFAVHNAKWYLDHWMVPTTIASAFAPIAFILFALLLLPFRAARSVTSLLFLQAGSGLAAYIWIYSCIDCYRLLGPFGMWGGICFFGVGNLFLDFIGLGIHREWPAIVGNLLWLGVTWLCFKGFVWTSPKEVVDAS